MKPLKGTQTERNLLVSFAGESQARNRYTFFASQAKKDGYVLVQAVFEEIANQEKEHAKKMFKWLEGSSLQITATYPAGVIGDTAANLRAAAAGEHEEWSADYPAFADKADEEGFPEIALMYRMISVAEKYHEERFRRLLERVEARLDRNERLLWAGRPLRAGWLRGALPLFFFGLAWSALVGFAVWKGVVPLWMGDGACRSARGSMR